MFNDRGLDVGINIVAYDIASISSHTIFVKKYYGLGINALNPALPGLMERAVRLRNRVWDVNCVRVIHRVRL
jgi:hypothetical protein